MFPYLIVGRWYPRVIAVTCSEYPAWVYEGSPTYKVFTHTLTLALIPPAPDSRVSWVVWWVTMYYRKIETTNECCLS